MELKKKYIGSFVWDKKMKRNIEVKYENINQLFKFDFLFEPLKPIKNDSVTAVKPKSNKRRTKRNDNKS